MRLYRLLLIATLIITPVVAFAAPTMNVTVVLVDVNGNRAPDASAGEWQNEVGDIFVPIPRTVTRSAGVLKAALTELFSFKEQFIGESGLYTALAQNTLTVTPTTFIRDGVAHVDLKGSLRIGGVGDVARYEEQIIGTVKANAKGVTAVHVTLNGKRSSWVALGNGRGWTDAREPKALDALYTTLRKSTGLTGYRFALTTLGLPTIEKNTLSIAVDGRFVRAKKNARLNESAFWRSTAQSLKRAYKLNRVTFTMNGKIKTF